MIPLELAMLDQWVCAWKDSKCPMQATQRKAASASDPSSWSSFAAAYAAIYHEVYDYLGFVFNNNGIVGIDIDEGYCGSDYSPLAKDIIVSCTSYTEHSRSGRGFHIFVKGHLPFNGRNNGKGIEIYQAKRYFIMTDNVFGTYDTLIENQAAIDYIVGKYFTENEVVEKTTTSTRDRIYNPVYKTGKDGKVSLKPEYPPIPAGSRHISLVSLAGQLHSKGYDRKSIYTKLSEANATACKPPLSDSEIQAITTSVCKYKR